MSPSSTVHGGQHDIKYVTFELLLQAAFVADEIWGYIPEPARMSAEAKHYVWIILMSSMEYMMSALPSTNTRTVGMRRMTDRCSEMVKFNRSDTYMSDR